MRTAARPILPLPWHTIDTVLLDMDGTLLDLHFDDVFFRQTVPQAYAEKKSIPFEKARSEIFAIYKTCEGTLAWYDLDHWSRTLEMDIPGLKNKVAHLIRIHPHVTTFLDKLKQLGRPITLVTNAHPKSVALKFEKTGLDSWIDTIVNSHDLGYPKETPEFWQTLKKLTGYRPEGTLLADDTESILIAAQTRGVAFPIHMAAPNSQKNPHFSQRFPSIVHLGEIMPP